MKTNSRIWLFTLIVTGMVFFLTNGCKKDSTPSIPVPIVETAGVAEITPTTATCGGAIGSDGGSTVTARGICWSTGTNPTVADGKTVDGAGAGYFISNITGLSPNTTYFVRAYATNGGGTGYGTTMSFITLEAVLPVLTTSPVTNISYTTATCGGNFASTGNSQMIVSGVCWSTVADPTVADSKTTDGSLDSSFTSGITGLSPGTTYFVRAYATNYGGTGYGNTLTFMTQAAQVPILTTSVVSNIALTTATSGGNVTSDGGSAITVRGVCWSAGTTPTVADSKTTDGSGTGTFISSLTGLSSNTTYYYRAYAASSAGTGYGNVLSFRTYYGTLTDIDGNVYNTVSIGTQIWMAENLKTTRYLDGSSITLVTDNNAWGTMSTTNKSYCYYDNSATNADIYGYLYSWAAAMNGAGSTNANPSGVTGVCPLGWHLPSNAEWNQLISILGGSAVAGGKMKEAGTTHWSSPNTGADNSSSFSALPGGYRDGDYGPFDYIGSSGQWWSTSKNDTNLAVIFLLHCASIEIFHYDYFVRDGSSVRCVKN